MCKTDKTIGTRLKTLRHSNGYTQQQVADYLKIDQSNYSKMERGVRRIRYLSQVHKLCDLYGCTEEFLLYGKEEYEPFEVNGMMKGMDLNIIVQMNITMKYLKMLRQIQKRNETIYDGE